MILARQFPRVESAAGGKLVARCANMALAEKAVYSFKRGGTTVEGPSIRLAEAIVQCWGNMRSGAYLVADGPEYRTMRCWAMDLETGNKQELDVTFAKLIQRKQGRAGKTFWVEPDARDLMELTNREAAKGRRNCIIGLVPRELVLQAMKQAKDTKLAGIKQDPDGYLRSLIARFNVLGIDARELEAFVGRPLGQLNADLQALEYLGSVAAGLEEGQPWKAYLEKLAKHESVKGKVASAQELRSKIAARASEVRPATQPGAQTQLGEGAK